MAHKKHIFDLTAALELWDSGLSCTAIGRKLGHYRGTVEEKLKEVGIDVQPRRPEIPFDLDRAKLLYADGYDCHTIGAELSCCAGRVLAKLRAAGVTIRRRGGDTADGKKIEMDDNMINEIIDLYLKGMPIEKVGHKWGLSGTPIRRVLIERGVRMRRGGMKRNFSPEQEVEIVALYQSGIDCPEISQRYDKSESSIFRTLKSNGVEIRSGEFATRIHTLNDYAFDCLGPEQLYWLGFCFADGCVLDKEHQNDMLSLNLQEGDIGHIEKFRAFLGSSHPITITKSTGYAKSGEMRANIRVSSSHMTRTLIGYGVVPRKSTVGCCPNLDLIVPDRNFWRGYVDGNGSVGLWGNKMRPGRLFPSLSVHGCKQMVDLWADFAEQYVGRRNKVSPAPGVFSWRSGCGTAQELVNLLYQDGDVLLERKMAIAQKISMWTPLKTSR